MSISEAGDIARHEVAERQRREFVQAAFRARAKFGIGANVKTPYWSLGSRVNQGSKGHNVFYPLSLHLRGGHEEECAWWHMMSCHNRGGIDPSRMQWVELDQSRLRTALSAMEWATSKGGDDFYHRCYKVVVQLRDMTASGTKTALLVTIPRRLNVVEELAFIGLNDRYRDRHKR